MSERSSAARYVLQSRLLRGVYVCLLVTGIGASVTAPQITLFLVRELHLSDTAAGLYYLTNLAAPIAGYVVGTLSDRAEARLLIFRLSALAGFVGWVLMAFAAQPWMPFAINILLLSVAGAGAAQLQAAVRDELTARPTAVDNQVVALMRMAMAFGWVIGPVIGAVAGAAIGLRPLLLATGLCMLFSLLPLIGVRAAPIADRTAEAASDVPLAPPRRVRSLLPLLAFTGIYVLIMCGETVKLAYLPLYMDSALHLSPVLRGAIIGLQPLIEVAMMPIAAKAADRFGITPVLYIGAGMAVAAHLLYAAAGDVLPHLVPLILGQVLMAGVIATFGVLGVTVAQQFQPSRVGMASSVFLSAFAINGAIGGIVGSVGTSWLGLPHMFWIPAALAVAGGVALAVLDRFVPLSVGVSARVRPVRVSARAHPRPE